MQKIIISNGDYEQYNFSIPFGKCLGNVKRKFIVSELELRHPCYSDAFCFDARLRFTKQGLGTDVVVMQKLKLMDYKKNCCWWNSWVFIQNSCFPRFVHKRIKKGIAGMILVIFIGLLGMGVYRELLRHKNDVLLEVDKNTVESNSLKVVESENNFFAPGELGESFLRVIKENKGTLEYINWNIDGFIEKINGSVSCLFPEQLSALGKNSQFSTVVYTKEKPEFQFSVQQLVKFDDEKKEINSDSGITKIRSFFLEKGIGIVEERNNPVSFKVNIENDFDIFRGLETVLEENSFKVTSLGINCNVLKGYVLEVAVMEGREYSKGLKLRTLYENREVFNNQKLNDVESIQKKSSVGKKVIKEELTKIGEVKYEGGKKLVFYKNKYGKMVKKLEGE